MEVKSLESHSCPRPQNNIFISSPTPSNPTLRFGIFRCLAPQKWLPSFLQRKYSSPEIRIHDILRIITCYNNAIVSPLIQMLWPFVFTIRFNMVGFYSLSPWLILLATLLLSDVAHGFTGTYGVNYGRIADNIPPPEKVVTLLKSAKIKNIRIYDADQSVLRAFSGSGIEIIVGLGNEFLRDISTSQVRAVDWVKQNVEPYLPGTKITGIAVGNEVLGGVDAELWEFLVPAVRNVYDALGSLRLADSVEVSSPHSEAVFETTYPPSAGAFKESVLPYMRPLLQFFARTRSPFYINAYPFLAYKSDADHIDLNYALFEKNRGITDPKTKLHYDNMFDAMVDASYFALEKVGFGGMEVIVSETGWGSKGDDNEAGANLKNARTYNRNLRKKLMKKKGTPHRPKRPVKAYIFALFNENLKPGPTSERNFGLFKADGTLSYDIGIPGVSSSAPAYLGSVKVLLHVICAAGVLFLI